MGRFTCAPVEFVEFDVEIGIEIKIKETCDA